MVTKVNSVAAEFRKVSDLQMAETTKRTIRENVTINQQLTKMSDKTMTLIQENEKLREKEKDLRRQLEILEFNEKEMARKNVSSKKVSQMDDIHIQCYSFIPSWYMYMCTHVQSCIYLHYYMYMYVSIIVTLLVYR